MKICPICQQKTDIYTTAHKINPFVDGKTYSILCFTCFFVPKILEQKYDKNELIIEEIDLPYCCSNFHTAKELYEQGSAETLKKAKICIESVKNACSKANKIKKTIHRPIASWNVILK